MISIDWQTGVISVPQADLVHVSGVIYELQLDPFRKNLNDLSDDSTGMPWPTTHNHTAPLVIGVTTLARAVELINGYTLTFEDTGSPYAVNISGGNSNLAEVTNINNVSVRSANSAGLVTSAGTGGPTVAAIVAGVRVELDEDLSLARDHARAANKQTQDSNE